MDFAVHIKVLLFLCFVDEGQTEGTHGQNCCLPLSCQEQPWFAIPKADGNEKRCPLSVGMMCPT